MIRLISYALSLGLAAHPAAAQEAVAVPSGQAVSFVDRIADAGTGSVRFRFLAPSIARNGGAVDFDTAAADMQFLCDNFALARIGDLDPASAEIVITFMDRVVEFGEPNPDATQFFDAYAVENGVCQWEGL